MPRPVFANRLRNLNQENPMNIKHYIGFDVHKKSISYCVKTADGKIIEEGKLRATHQALREWAQKRTEPWHGAMEATLFSSWIYDVLKPYAAELQMGNPSMMKAIGAAKKKNDKLDARKIADLVRCNLLPVCYTAAHRYGDITRCANACKHGLLTVYYVPLIMRVCICGSAGDARSAAVAALPEPGGGTGGADEEPNERAVDGSGRGIQQTTTARGQV